MKNPGSTALRVLIEASPLDNGHATRGIGRYAAGVLFGLNQLDSHPEVAVVRQAAGCDLYPDLPRVLPEPMLPGVSTSWKLLEHLEATLPDLLERTQANILHLLDPLLIPRPRPGLRVIATVQDLIPLLLREHRIRWRTDMGRAWWHYHRVFLRRLASIDTVIVPSLAVADDVVNHAGVDRSRIRVIVHGADEAAMDPELSEGQKVALPEGPFFLFVGAADKRKNLERVIKALAISGLPHRLVLAGKPGDGNLERLREVARQVGVGDRIVLTGFVNDATLSGLYRRADGLVFPSLAEGFGLPVLEAMREECPVVTSSTGCLPEVAGEAALLVDPMDVQAIAGAMSRLAGDSSVRDALRARGVERAAGFRWIDAARSIVDVWQESR